MEIGAIIKDQYRVVEHIGRGGMADVWSARDNRLNRLVAIKTIARKLSPDVDPVRRFENEAQTIAQMEHPHILPVYDFGEHQGRLYIVMRFVTGGTLDDRLRSGPLDPYELLRMAELMARALDYAHSRKVIHLDLKPANILLDSAGSPYLADFGLATVLDPEGRARNPGAGTVLYMAPEQFVSDVIDYRADVYSFSLLMYHALTGRLPFDGEALAVRQLHHDAQLPDPRTLNPDLPAALVDVLRLGTSQYPSHRPSTHLELVEAMQDAMVAGHSFTGASAPYYDEAIPLDAPLEADSALLEAVDLYSRARHAWAGGQGRFLLGLTHYMLMADYYRDAGRHGLTTDEAGLQMLLRGALEYDYDIERWWGRLGDDSRRWVCLHTLRSGTTPARIRALRRLETLPDDEVRPTIPLLVAQALEVERDEEARIAALQVLGTRARMLKPRSSVRIQTAYRGSLLTTMTRLGIQLLPPSAWIDSVYSPEIDLLIAREALEGPSPRTEELAARLVGRLRSLTGVRYLANEQRRGRPGALRALSLVRDEAPSLPDVVSPQARAYAWLTNTLRHLTENPLSLVLRFIAALLGGWIGMGQFVYITFRSEALFSAPRWSNSIGFGLIFALIVALTVLVSDEASRRLRGFWPWWARLLICGGIGWGLGTLTWSASTWLFFTYIPVWDMMWLAGFALAAGFIISALLNWGGWRATLLSAALIYLPMIAFHEHFFGTGMSVAPFALIGLALGLLVGWQAVSRVPERVEPLAAIPQGLRIVLAGAAGLGWTVVLWWTFGRMLEIQAAGGVFNWTNTLFMMLLAILVGLLAGFFLTGRARIVFGGAALLSSVGLLFVAGPSLAGMAPPRDVPLFYFDQSHLDAQMQFWVFMPMAFTIALGAYAPDLLRAWWRWVGRPREAAERSAWPTAVLAYVIVTSGLASVLALFSAHVSVIWALLWSAFAALVFVAALATWRRALWGAQTLIVLAMAFVPAGLLFDVLHSIERGMAGRSVDLLRPETLLIWALAAVGVGLCVWGVRRQQLWAGIGIVLALLSWYTVAIFTAVPGSMTIFALIHLALLAYALLPIWPQMERDRMNPPPILVPLPEDNPAQTQALADLPMMTAALADGPLGTADFNDARPGTQPLAVSEDYVSPEAQSTPTLGGEPLWTAPLAEQDESVFSDEDVYKGPPVTRELLSKRPGQQKVVHDPDEEDRGHNPTAPAPERDNWDD